MNNDYKIFNEKCKVQNLESGYFIELLEYQESDINLSKFTKVLTEYLELIKNNDNYYLAIFKRFNGNFNIKVVQYTESEKEAARVAKKQLSDKYYDIGNNTNIYIDYDVKIYSLYRIIYDFNNQPCDEQFIRQYNNTREIPSNYRRDKAHFNVYVDKMSINELV